MVRRRGKICYESIRKTHPARASLAQGDKGSTEARGDAALLFDGRVERDARLASLPEPTLEIGQLVRLRADADRAEFAAHRTLVRDRALADHDVAFDVLQLHPEHSVAAEDGQRVDAAAEARAEMIGVS